MKALFKHLFGLIAILLIFTITANAATHFYHFKAKAEKTAAILKITPILTVESQAVKALINLTFDTGDIPLKAEPLYYTATIALPPVNDANPDNTNLQLILSMQLKVRQMESNV
jgi:hypothetical protein